MQHNADIKRGTRGSVEGGQFRSNFSTLKCISAMGVTSRGKHETRTKYSRRKENRSRRL
jgi:hypothetical protein